MVPKHNRGGMLIRSWLCLGIVVVSTYNSQFKIYFLPTTAVVSRTTMVSPCIKKLFVSTTAVLETTVVFVYNCGGIVVLNFKNVTVRFFSAVPW